jgi:peptide/nickel transport system permease protein
MKRVGTMLMCLVALVTLGARWLAPNPPDRQFRDHLFAPPTPIHLIDERGQWRSPYIYVSQLVSRLERRYGEDKTRAVRLEWFARGKLVSVPDDPAAPLLLLGADAFGRDIVSRVLYGARTSIGLATVSTLAAILIGVTIGGIAGYAGGFLDELLSRASDFVLVLPAVYVVLALRAVMPLVLSARAVFVLMTIIFAFIGWALVARGVRAIIAAERDREYAQAARAVGAGHARMLFVHLLPATTGFLAVQATLLLPGFILAEATLSYVGLGFPDRMPSWGTMLYDAANIAVLADIPWALAPAVAIFIVVLAVNLVVQGSGRPPIELNR